MANYKTVKFTVPHGVEETSPGVFSPATIDVDIRNADGSIETLAGLTVIDVIGTKGITLDLGTNPCCVNIISGPYEALCPAEDLLPANTCTPSGTPVVTP